MFSGNMPTSWSTNEGASGVCALLRALETGPRFDQKGQGQTDDDGGDRREDVEGEGLEGDPDEVSRARAVDRVDQRHHDDRDDDQLEEVEQDVTDR